MSRRVVVASGYFNPLHYGHVSYLEKAKESGHSLIVVVNNDVQAARLIDEGRDYVSLPARERVKLVRSLACVDLAIEAVDTDESVAETLRLLHPDVFANGGSAKPTKKERDICISLGIQMVDGLGMEIVPLKGFTQHYDWGKPRESSVVAKLAGEQTTPPGCTNPQDAAKPFAELWMGDHPSGPSSVLLSPPESPANESLEPRAPRASSLTDLLVRSPSLLGPKLSASKQLPFLLKVLSIHKALSIQAHPDRALAARLHRERPDLYKDANHKPEIAIALSDDFEALCGFRTHAQIVELLEDMPELRALVGTDEAVQLEEAKTDEAQKAALAAAFGTLMRQPAEAVREQATRLNARAEAILADGSTSPERQKLLALVRRLYNQYGDDVGIFSALLMNYVQLGKGSCLYMAQNVPHAYLSGDIVECMACSDNVVRGGLTPKFKDIEVLCEMLDYRGRSAHIIHPVKVEEGVHLYADRVIEEFQVTHVSFEKGRQKRMCFSSVGPSMVFTNKGTGTIRISGEYKELSPGTVFMLSSGVEPDIMATTSLDLFVACCPPDYFK